MGAGLFVGTAVLAQSVRIWLESVAYRNKAHGKAEVMRARCEADSRKSTDQGKRGGSGE
ncbi:hypothetical protein [Streptomyces niveus]|uniref:hypothetical protein n=1 Tax=Streptomyces niveus TaxID=193462 RepID=UPI0035E0589F